MKLILMDETASTHTDWNTEEPQNRQDIMWKAGPKAIEDITEGQFNTDPDTITADKSFYSSQLLNYSGIIFDPDETPTTARAVTSGHKKKKIKRQKNSGKNLAP